MEPGFVFLSTLSLRRATLKEFWKNVASLQFLSTLSLRRATGFSVFWNKDTEDFYPRSPCGERQARLDSRQHPAGISIHALLAESDRRPKRLKSRRCVFLSTLSLRRATCYSLRHSTQSRHFYPRSPCGERPEVSERVPLAEYFYPRSPCGERLLQS